MILPVIYLDHHAHTPLDPKVLSVLTSAWTDADVNVHALSPQSEAVRQRVEIARTHVAALVGALPADVVFTSGATEANNLAILGVAAHLRLTNRRTIIVSAGEHPSVHATADGLGDDFRVRAAPLLSSGQVDLDALADLIDETTGLVSIAGANHEIGTIQPLHKIAALAQSRGALFHSDLAQAAGKVPVALGDDVQLASISAHKMYGPLGVGALIARRSVRRIMRTASHGGGQENGLRSGTLPAPLCIAFGEACRIATSALLSEGVRIAALRDRLLDQIQSQSSVTVNGTLNDRLPGNLNLQFPGVDAEALVMKLRAEVTLATGSACHAHALEPSPVLMALGLSQQQAESSVRIGLGRFTTEEQIDDAARRIVDGVAELRAVRRSVSA